MSSAELDPPEPAIVIEYSEVDRVGRMRLATGEELRFGANVCHGLAPTIGAQVFVTSIGPHPMGGRKALSVRAEAKTEASLRAADEASKADEVARVAHELKARRERILAQGAADLEGIVARIKAAVDDGEADKQLLYELTDDLTLVGASVDHIKAIVIAILELPPMTHFGSPGALVHYVEKIAHEKIGLRRYEEILFRAARAQPTSHFLWMLARLANEKDELAQRARALLHSWTTHPKLPAELREPLTEYLARR